MWKQWRFCSVFTFSRILWYLRVAWSLKSRTVHPGLQGTTTEVSPKVTVTFIPAVNSNVSDRNNPTFDGSSAPRARTAAPVRRGNRRNRCRRCGNHGNQPTTLTIRPSNVRPHYFSPSWSERVIKTAQSDFVSCWAERWNTHKKTNRETNPEEISATLQERTFPPAASPCSPFTITSPASFTPLRV